MAKRNLKLMWMQFSTEAGLVRANTREERRGELVPTGEDHDFKLDELSEDTRNLVLDAADAIAEELGATVYEPPKDDDEK